MLKFLFKCNRQSKKNVIGISVSVASEVYIDFFQQYTWNILSSKIPALQWNYSSNLNSR